MVSLPIPIVGALLAGAALYGGYRSIRGGYENSQYWKRYYAKTGITPRYPVRSGYSYDYSRALYGGAAVAGLYSPRPYGYRKHHDPAIY